MTMNIFQRSVTGCLAGIALSACSMTLPVDGEFQDDTTRFLGEATGYMDGSGNLDITTPDGVKCSGTFQYANARVTGQGGFNCTDGRTGDFFFTSNGTQGKGFGKTDRGELFRFTFGGPGYTAARQGQWEALGRSFTDLSRSINPPTTYCNVYGNSVRCQTFGR